LEHALSNVAIVTGIVASIATIATVVGPFFKKGEGQINEQGLVLYHSKFLSLSNSPMHNP
jgi:hypothetical protein